MRTINTIDDRPEDESREGSVLVWLRRAYVRFLQGLFYAAPRGHYHWEENEELSEIQIGMTLNVDVGSVGQRPVITVLRAPVVFKTLGLDDVSRRDMRTGAKQRAMLLLGTMTINVCASAELEADKLAGYCADHLIALRDRLLRAGFFNVAHNIEIGAPSPPGKLLAGDGAREWFCVTIASPFSVSRLTQTTPLAQEVVQAFDVSLHVEGGGAHGNPGGPAPEGLPFAQQVESRSAVDDGLPRVPHPLDPTRLVTVRTVRPYAQGVRLGGRLPLPEAPVGDSSSGLTPRVKV